MYEVSVAAANDVGRGTSSNIIKFKALLLQLGRTFIFTESYVIWLYFTLGPVYVRLKNKLNDRFRGRRIYL